MSLVAALDFSNKHIYNSLFFEICSHRIEVLQKNVNTDLEMLGKKSDNFESTETAATTNSTPPIQESADDDLPF